MSSSFLSICAAVRCRKWQRPKRHEKPAVAHPSLSIDRPAADRRQTVPDSEMVTVKRILAKTSGSLSTRELEHTLHMRLAEPASAQITRNRPIRLNRCIRAAFALRSAQI
jgi:hypothetical protein